MTKRVGGSVLAVDAEGKFWVVRVVPDSEIGPFETIAEAQAAQNEIQAAAAKKETH
jgi:hypothetical protein